MPTYLLIGRPGFPLRLNHVIDRIFSSDRERYRTRFGFAYATESGLEVILELLAQNERWKLAEKLWILGLHQGLTEPAAIEKIRALPNSQVRLFVGGDYLNFKSLVSGHRFHGKIMSFERLLK